MSIQMYLILKRIKRTIKFTTKVNVLNVEKSIIDQIRLKTLLKELNNKRSRKYRERNPLKAKARSLVRTALRNGSLIRPDKCLNCSKECIPEAHHYDYSKPLEVEWLCKQCHENTHHKK